MKAFGYEPYVQMSFNQVKERANQVIEGRMTRKGSLLIAMFTAEKEGYWFKHSKTNNDNVQEEHDQGRK